MFESKKTLKAKIAELEKEVAFYKREVRDGEARLNNAKGYIKDIQEEIKAARTNCKNLANQNKKLRDDNISMMDKIKESRRADVVYACFKTLLEMGLEIRNKKASTQEQYKSKSSLLTEVLAGVAQRNASESGVGYFNLPLTAAALAKSMGL